VILLFNLNILLRVLHASKFQPRSCRMDEICQSEELWYMRISKKYKYETITFFISVLFSSTNFAIFYDRHEIKVKLYDFITRSSRRCFLWCLVIIFKYPHVIALFPNILQPRGNGNSYIRLRSSFFPFFAKMWATIIQTPKSHYWRICSQRIYLLCGGNLQLILRSTFYMSIFP